MSVTTRATRCGSPSNRASSTLFVGNYLSRLGDSAALGGLSLDVHHAYDPGFPKTYFGHGGSFGDIVDDGAVLSTPGFGLSYPSALACGADGSV